MIIFQQSTYSEESRNLLSEGNGKPCIALCLVKFLKLTFGTGDWTIGFSYLFFPFEHANTKKYARQLTLDLVKYFKKNILLQNERQKFWVLMKLWLFWDIIFGKSNKNENIIY